MKKLNFLFITLFLTIAFIGVNECLFGIVDDIHGQGNAVWGHTKAKTKDRFARRIKLGEVSMTEGPNFLIVNYRKGRVMKKRYDFKNNSLYKITLTYTHRGQRIINTYNSKYKPYNKIENNTYIWIFPSTIITHKQGTSKAVFIDRQYATSVIAGQKNIDDIRIGMTTNEVRQLMGTPIATATASGGITTYRYRTGVITFQYSKVTKIEKVQLHVIASQNNIDKIKVGMTTDQVRQIMGMPLESKAIGNIIIYKYNTGSITFKFQRVKAVTKTK